jgi:hypothetical protein
MSPLRGSKKFAGRPHYKDVAPTALNGTKLSHACARVRRRLQFNHIVKARRIPGRHCRSHTLTLRSTGQQWDCHTPGRSRVVRLSIGNRTAWILQSTCSAAPITAHFQISIPGRRPFGRLNGQRRGIRRSDREESGWFRPRNNRVMNDAAPASAATRRRVRWCPVR